VRGVRLGQSDPGGDYVRIRIAGEPDYFMDFEAPEFWVPLMGCTVSIDWYWTTGTDGFDYHVVVDATVEDDR
jgi:hypothetical protein